MYQVLPHFTLQHIPRFWSYCHWQKLWFLSDGWEKHFVIEKVQFRGWYFKYLYQNELEVGLLPTPLLNPQAWTKGYRVGLAVLHGNSFMYHYFELADRILICVQPVPPLVTSSKSSKQSSKLKLVDLFCQNLMKRDLGALASSLFSSLGKCHCRWDRLPVYLFLKLRIYADAWLSSWRYRTVALFDNSRYQYR